MSLRRRTNIVIGTAVMGLLAAACGSSNSHSTMPGMDHTGGAAATGARAVEVTMADTKFDPSSIEVKAGESVRFVFRNQGKLPHEAVIGDSAAQNAHEMEMASTAGMGMHDTAAAVTIAPGNTGQLTYTFKTAGQLVIGCHQPGHYAAGMKLNVTVT